MPRLHKAHYQGLASRIQLDMAIAEADPMAVWGLLKGQGYKPGTSRLDQVMRAVYFDSPTRVQAAATRELGPEHIDSGHTFIVGPTDTEKAHGRAQLRIANMLFRSGVDASASYPVPGMEGIDKSWRQTTAAQEAFALETITKPSLPVLAAIVLETLRLKPGWQPDLNFIFRNIIEVDPQREADLRRQQAKHIRQLGLTVGARLNNVPHMRDEFGNLRPSGVIIGGHKQKDKAAKQAADAMRPAQLIWWTDSRRWEINPETMPWPTAAMRAVYTAAQNERWADLKATLHERGLLDGGPGKSPALN